MALRGAISFFTTIPAGGDIEGLRKNLWLFPVMGAFVGVLVSLPIALSLVGVNVRCLAVLVYIAVEGINHIDGLSDFGDALFAPESRKKEALKDTKIGAGGVVLAVLYIIFLFNAFNRASVISVIISQIFAKYSMLLLLVFSKPSWEGMASYMMEYASIKDAIIGTILLSPSFLYTPIIPAFFLTLAITLIMKKYSEKKFDGVSGDIIGATNCIVFVSTLYLLNFATKNPAVLWRWG